MPAYRLSLSVRVGGEIDFLIFVHRLRKPLDGLFLVGSYHILRFEAVLYVDAEGPLRQIAVVPLGGEHHGVGAEIFLYGLCL